MKPLTLYGVPLSQPVRAVMWLMLMKRLPFEMVLINPGSSGEGGSRHPDYLAKNPGGTVPCIEEPDTGFTLGEAHAIMPYLARTQGWTDVYPADDRQRARIDMYLHYHHRNVREATIGLVTPMLRKDLDIPEVVLASASRTLTGALNALENGYLEGNEYLMGDSLTLADLAAYADLGQLQPQFANLYDFSAFPNVQRWLNTMTQVDSHDDVHIVLKEMGDLSQGAPDMDTIRNANKSALRALKARLAAL